MSLLTSITKGLGQVAGLVETGANAFAAVKNAKSGGGSVNLAPAIEAAKQGGAAPELPDSNLNNVVDRIEAAVRAVRAPAAPPVVVAPAPAPVQSGGQNMLVIGAMIFGFYLLSRK